MNAVETIGKISVRSDHEVEWVIENFFSYTDDDDTSYSSPQFSIKSKDWLMEIYPNGETSENTTGWIAVYLHVLEAVPPVGVSFTFGVKKVDGSIEYSHRTLIWVFEETDGYGFYKFLERSKLQRRNAEFMLSKALTVTCRLRTPEDFETSAGLGTLSQDLANMFHSKKCCDTTLNVKGKEFLVHRSILSARSSVFNTMFEIEMKEKRTGIVDISDCDPESFREFLFYLYSDKIEKVPRDAFELYKIADKYNVKDLKSYCALFILINLSLDNVLDAYFLGRQYFISGLEWKAQKFFNKNFPKIVQTAKWKELLFDKPFTADELLAEMAKEMEMKI